MHKTKLSEATLRKAHAIRGGTHIYTSITPGRTAHLVIDLQEGFVSPSSVAYVQGVEDILPNVNRISSAIRETGGKNIFLRYLADKGAKGSWSVLFNNVAPAYSDFTSQTFVPGNPLFELSAELTVAPADIVLNKTRMSAFVPGTCELPSVLRDLGVDTLIVSGTVSNGCCESTVRDAMQQNYRVLFVTDANAAASDDDHNATVNSLALIFSDVVDTEQTVALLQNTFRVQS